MGTKPDANASTKMGKQLLKGKKKKGSFPIFVDAFASGFVPTPAGTCEMKEVEEEEEEKQQQQEEEEQEEF